MLTPVCPPMIVVLWETGTAIILASTSAISVLTMVYTITCLIYYCRGKLHPLSLLYIDFGATFLWMYATITMIYGVEAPTTDATIHGGADLWRCMVGDLFMAITNHGGTGGKAGVPSLSFHGVFAQERRDG